MKRLADQFRANRPKLKLSDQVAEQLRLLVSCGEYGIGDLLPSESSMTRQLGVSRTVLREAISRLKAEGLLHSRQGKGVIVAAISPPRGFALPPDDRPEERVLRILELRLGLEAEAAALAASRRDQAELALMRAALRDMSLAVARGEIAGGVAADMRFHGAICDATGNPHYAALFEYLSGQLMESICAGRRRAVAQQGGGLDALAEHREILEAIAASSPEAARLAARRHVEQTVRRLSVAGRTDDPRAQPETSP